MPHILVATDFSDVANNAVHYACKLAGDYHVSICVLHSFIIPVTFSDTPMPVMPIDEGRQIAEERMQEMVNSLTIIYPGLTITSKIMFGDVTDCLEEYAEKEQPWMIVLGNSGLGNTTIWLGSNVLSALKNLKHTVVAIPGGFEYKKPGKLCFACDFKNVADHLQTEKMLQLTKETGAQLHVLNVDYQNRNYSTDMLLESTDLHEALKAVNPVYHYVEKENVEEGIQEFVDANSMDWLIIVPHKHSFFESLFHKSHTKAIMKMVHIPLIALHEK